MNKEHDPPFSTLLLPSSQSPGPLRTTLLLLLAISLWSSGPLPPLHPLLSSPSSPLPPPPPRTWSSEASVECSAMMYTPPRVAARICGLGW